MKLILFAFLIFYSLAISTRVGIVSYSGDNSVEILTNQQSSIEKVSLHEYLKSNPEHVKQPSNWAFLKDKCLGGLSKWITPKPTQEIYPLFWLTTYVITFQNNCPKSSIFLKITATSIFQIILNDQKLPTWYKAWPKISELSFKAQCGLNKLKVIIFNYHHCSPAALGYTLIQNTKKCQNCPQRFVFDPNSCRCLCIQKPICLQINQVFDQKLCKCVSKCPVPQPCPKGKVWDAFNCQCICQLQPAKCPGNFIWNPDTCSCYCVPAFLCSLGSHFDNKLCECVVDKPPKKDKECESGSEEKKYKKQHY